MDVEITSRIGLKSLSTPSSTALWVQAARLMPLLLTAQTLMVADGRPRTLPSVAHSTRGAGTWPLVSQRSKKGECLWRGYGVGVAGSAQGEFDLVTRLQLRKIDRRSDREFHRHCRPVDGRDRTMIECDLVVRCIQGRVCAGQRGN
jgi:hypothetical protein